MQSKYPTKTVPSRVEVQPQIWLPSAHSFGSVLQSNKINYAIFGAGALAVQNVMIRPTIDIDFVVDDYTKAIELLKEQPGLASSNLEKERDGIQVADFYFKSGITVQIWDNNLYSLPMTDNSWSRVILGRVRGFGMIRCISMEDLIVSKVGRHTQQRKDSEYEADKNVNDIVATIQTLSKPDFDYVIQRLKEGARRESTSNSSKIHNLDWYFVREVPIYAEKAKMYDQSIVGKFISTVLVNSKSMSIEYDLLHNLRKIKNLGKFQSSFLLEEKHLEQLLKRWEKIVKNNNGKINVSSKSIQEYIDSDSESLSEYARKIVYSGKK